MGLSRLAKACRKCPYVDTCKHKRMEALGYLPMPKIKAVNKQTTEIKVNNISLDSLSDILKPIINANLRINETRKQQ